MRRGPALDALSQAAVVAGEPEAQPALADLILLHVFHQPENLAEVVAGDLLGGLSDLERGLGGRAKALLGNEELASGRDCLSCSASVNPASPPPSIATS